LGKKPKVTALEGPVLSILLGVKGTRNCIGEPGTEVHSCNPSVKGGRDQKDGSSKSVQIKEFSRPYHGKKKKSQKRAGGVTQAVRAPA
jgi:hypothetical protein